MKNIKTEKLKKSLESFFFHFTLVKAYIRFLIMLIPKNMKGNFFKYFQPIFKNRVLVIFALTTLQFFQPKHTMRYRADFC